MSSMNSMSLFSYGTQGIVTDQQMNFYAQQVEQNYLTVKAMGGMLADKADNNFKEFNAFMDSRAWELSSKLAGVNGSESYGRWKIGRMSRLESLQNAEGLMANYILSNPDVMQLYLDGNLEGYGEHIAGWNFGIGEDNYFYRRQNSGVRRLINVDDEERMVNRRYSESIQPTGLSVQERLDLAYTQRTVNHLLASSVFDITSSDNAYRADRKPEETDE